MSELCLDTSHFGWRVDEATSHALLDRFRGAGGTFLQTWGAASDDTAVSERFIGRWIQSRKVPRGEIIVACCCDIADDLGPSDVFRTTSVLRSRCEHTLRELNARYLDLLMVQWSDKLAMDEVLLAAETLVRAGLIRHFAVRDFPAWRVMEWLGHSARRNLCHIAAMQVELSLLTNAALNLESMALARAQRVGIVARAPLAGGLLAKRVHDIDTQDSRAIETINLLGHVASVHGVSPAKAAVSWVLAHADVSSVLVGPHTEAQLQDHCAATSLGLTFSDLGRLDGQWKRSLPLSCDDADEPEDATDPAFRGVGVPEAAEAVTP